MSNETQEFASASRVGKRVRILSPDGLAVHTKFIDSETGEEIPRIIEAVVEWNPGSLVKAHLTTLLAQTDIVAEAEVECITAETYALRGLVAEARALLLHDMSGLGPNYETFTRAELLETFLEHSSPEHMERMATVHPRTSSGEELA